MAEQSLLARLGSALRSRFSFPSKEIAAIDSATAPQIIPPPRNPNGSAWQPLPGNMIELGSTGFQIVLDVSPRTPLYTLRAPEGWLIGWGSDLAGLKQLGERYARERLEFVYTERLWKP